jgi:DNA polymerase-3 subunit alpha
MAGFSLGEADLLRRAVSKKDRTILEKEREHFVVGAQRKGYDQVVANDVYDMIVRFANYGFNRSHAVAYSVIAYQTAYLKANYPVEFLTALISESMGNPSKVVEYIEEARRKGIRILPPDVKKSKASFSIEEGSIRIGFAAIKNIGENVIEAILAQKEDTRDCTTVLDFCMKSDSKLCTRKVMESLILSGAFDSFGVHRAKLMGNLDDLLDRINQKRKLEEDLQIYLFEDFTNEVNNEFAWIEVREYAFLDLLKKEKEVLGLYLSGHPLSSYKEMIERYTTHNFDELAQLSEETLVTLGGMVTDIKQILTRRKEQMAFVRLEIIGDEIELIFFPESFRRYKEQLEIDQGILIQGRVSHNEEITKIIVNKLVTLDELVARNN